jgi:hypothetical protein
VGSAQRNPTIDAMHASEAPHKIADIVDDYMPHPMRRDGGVALR